MATSAGSVPKAKGGSAMKQRKLSLTDTGLGLEEPERKIRYSPPEHFKLLEGAEPLVEQALDSNTELWLVRIPANEISQEDLVEKKLRINVNSADGEVGQFCSSQGQEYRIVKQDCGDYIQPYAIVPSTSGHFRVRKIRRQVGLVRSLGVAKDTNASETSSQRDQEVVNPEKPVDKLPKKKQRHENPGSA
ncbi:hypothetical protein R1sor_018456 [Riccia sorocarpa]|uniref:Uncharacterized protein n=1 Tax=Riccia sorocarpa TaxID=122646 RepID=A0ABD3IBE7_9MARC